MFRLIKLFLLAALACNAASTKSARFGSLALLAFLSCLSTLSFANESSSDELFSAVPPSENSPALVVDQYEFTQYSSPLFVFPAAGDFDLTGYMKHLVSVNTLHEDDFIHKVYGSADLNASINVPEGMYNDFIGGATAGSSPCYDPAFYLSNTHTNDSWVGIGLTCTPSFLAEESDVTIDETESNPWSDNFQIETFFSGNSGPVDITMDGASSAGAWYLPNTSATNGFAGEDCKSVVMQITSEGAISWTLNAEIWVHGDENTKVILTQTYDGESMGPPIIEGCTNDNACNYYDLATSDDGSCEYLSCSLGCTIPTACNYNPLSQFEDGSCTYALEGYDCDGNCLNDVDDDGICDANEVAGCEDPTACNYSSNATETGSCVYATDLCATCSGQSDGTGVVVDGDTDGDDVCDIDEIIGCQDPEACNYNSSATDPATCVFATDCDTCSGATDGTGIVVDGDGDDNGICDVDEGCSDSVACNFDVNGTGVENCMYPAGCETCSGETDGTGTILPGQDTDSDGVCDADEVPGCTNESAENYNDSATDDDGSCYFSPDWTVIPTPASGMVLGHITVDAIAASEEDWIGAFTPDAVCAGATQPIIQDGLAYISLVVYGDDALTNGVSEGMNEGEDFTLQFFDASANVSYLYHEEDGQWLMSGWTNTNGTPLPDYDDPAREFAFTSIPYEPECGDPIACNYQVGGLDPNACEYPEAGVDCDGNCLVDEDNDNVCDGIDSCVGQLDACGVCNGPGEIYTCGCAEILEGYCNCDGDQLDECGVCGGTGIPDGDCDCDGSQLDALGDCGGSCASDSDNDGVCDDVDPCVGTPDACGVCNGPGAIYECGCADLPSSDCNCDGDQLDALGVCGGACASDSDSDGICDDVDPCVGQYDECGVCNGSGPVTGYDCDGICLEDCDADGVCDDYEVSGCVYESACNYNSAATDDDGSCTYPTSGEDCSGNCLFDVDDDQICDQDEITGCQDDAACNYDATATDAGYCDYPETNYDCDGNCLNDADQDGICDELEVDGCADSNACNYEADTDSDEDCDYCSCAIDSSLFYGLEVVQHAVDIIEGMTTYRVYAKVVDADDFVSAVFGSEELPLAFQSSSAFYNSEYGGVTAWDINANFLVLFPELYADSWVTIGVEDSDSGSAITVLESPAQNWSGSFASNSETDGQDFAIDDAAGGGWFILGDATNGVPDSNLRVLLMQVTTAGSISGTFNVQMFPLGDANNEVRKTFHFDGLGVFLDESIPNCGCTDQTACNFDATATEAGYCDYPETNYDCSGNCLNDADQDGICDEFEVAGCTDSSACNYDQTATDDDASCAYAIAGYDCNGDCLVDSDQDQICDQDEVVGCQDDSACNYDATATDAGYCDYPETNYDCDGNCLNDSDQDGICDELEVAGCTDSLACNYDSSATDEDSSCTYAQAGFDCDGNCLVDSDNDQICDQDEITGCQDDSACNYDATATDAGYCDYPETNYDCDGNCLNDADQDGICDEIETDGCTDSSACNYDSDATDEDGSCTYAQAGFDCDGNCLVDSDNDQICDQDEIVGCQDDSACNYDATATDAGYCDYPETNYDCDGNCLNDSDQDGICDAFEVAGCTDSLACNYDPAATDDDASCTYAIAGLDCNGDCLVDSDNDQICDQDEITGCQDDSACNYDATATDEGYCDYPETNYDCDGNCLNDSDQDGICDAFEVEGCTTPSACNFNAAATEADGSCAFAEAGYDCDGNCLIDLDNDGICDLTQTVGCLDSSACNYDATATDAGYCDYPETNYDCDGNCLNDSDQDGICNEFEVVGCTDSSACNYDPAATDYDASCTYGTAGFDCDGDCLVDSDNDQICDQNEVTGCQDDSACNYDATATDAGYCDYPETNYDCDGNCLNDSDQDGICNEFEVVGCTDSSACNYDPAATDYDASCTYGTAGFDCDGNCLIDSDNDGICDQNEILGCTDPNSFDFQPLATEDDGSCIYCNVEIQLDVVMGDQNESGNGYAGVSIISGYPPFTYYWIGPAGFESNDEDILGLSAGNYTLFAVDAFGCEAVLSLDILDFGCDDSEACNYNPVVSGGGSCDYPETNFDCDGNCLNDSDQDGICNEFEVAGCTDSAACNYDSTATDDDASCTYATAGLDCNGNCLLDSDNDQICDQDEITGCQDVSACNYDSSATDAGYCDYPDEHYDCDGICLNDSDEDGICDEFEVAGCTDNSACNYNADSTDDDASCSYAQAGYDCDGNCLVDSDNDQICDQDEITGCQDTAACNYDATATDAGYCDYPETNYDCDGNCLNDANQDGICDENESIIEAIIDAAVVSALEEFLAAVAAGDYCGEGTIWVPEWNECIAVPSCFGDLDNDGNRGTEDLLQLLSVYGTGCPLEFGCTDPTAENYDPFAVYDNGSCIIPVVPCDNLESVNYAGVEYGLLTIGDDCWFDANLYSTEYANGDAIEVVNSSFNWYQAGADENPAAIEVVEDPEEGLFYGYFYNAFAVLDSRGVCPTDWHVASNEDWMALESHLGMDAAELEILGSRGTDQGEQLKATSTHVPAWDGTDAIDFTAVPAGQRFNFGSFSGFGSKAVFWTNTTQGSSTMMSRILDTGSTQIQRTSTGNAFGASVRCVKDE